MKDDFTIPLRIEQAYQRLMRRLLFPKLPPKGQEQTYQDWLAGIAAISDRRDVADAAAYVAAQMVRWISVENAKTWREASARSQRSRMLYRLLQNELQGPVGKRMREIVADNAGYIKRIPAEVAERLTADISKMQMAGSRPETIAKFMRQRFPAMTRNRIKLIARTETMKTSAALTRSRAEQLDLNFFLWETSRDTRVRASHRNLQGVLVRFNDPPQPEALIHEHSTLGRGIPGEFPNCRCWPRVIMTLDDVNWPVRMYGENRIFMITRAQFSRRFGFTEERAA